jgi:DNA-binding HxlR family transcriptional regulator
MIGPRRFNQLLKGLPSIGTNLLSQRLEELTALGVIQKALKSGNRQSCYELTDVGYNLEPVILSMARWGMQYIAQSTDEQLVRDDLLVVVFKALFDPQQALGVEESYEIRVGDICIAIEINNGKMNSSLGPAKLPAFVFTTDSITFNKISNGQLNLDKAEQIDKLHILGDRQAYERFLLIFENKNTVRSKSVS